MIAIIGTSDRPCWLAEACKILLLLLLLLHVIGLVVWQKHVKSLSLSSTICTLRDDVICKSPENCSVDCAVQACVSRQRDPYMDAVLTVLCRPASQDKGTLTWKQ